MTESLVDVALLAYGGPESPEQIVPFLERLMGRTPDPGTIAAVQERYALIGGASPLPAITVAPGAGAAGQARPRSSPFPSACATASCTPSRASSTASARWTRARSSPCR